MSELQDWVDQTKRDIETWARNRWGHRFESVELISEGYVGDQLNIRNKHSESHGPDSNGCTWHEQSWEEDS